MRTYSPKPQDIKRDWLVVDVKNIPIGRAASQIASLLRGKHKTTFSPHVDMGDAVIVINASGIGATGGKELDKKYYRHTGYPGGIKSVPLGKMRKDNPERIMQLAVKNMLPKGPLGRAMIKKLWVYAGAEHPHLAQQPKAITLEY